MDSLCVCVLPTGRTKLISKVEITMESVWVCGCSANGQEK